MTSRAWNGKIPLASLASLASRGLRSRRKIRSPAANGSPRRKVPSTIAYIAVVRPIPSASVSTATPECAGYFHSLRTPRRSAADIVIESLPVRAGSIVDCGLVSRKPAPVSKIIMRTLLAALTLFLMTAPMVLSMQMEIQIDPDLQAKLKGFEARLEALRQEQRIAGLSVAIVKDREIIYLKGLGSAGDGRPATPDTAYPVPSLKRSPGQPPWTVRELARLDVVLDRGGVPEKKPYLNWHFEESGGTRLQWFAERGKGASALYLKVPEKKLTLILLANDAFEKTPFTQSFLKTFP